MSRNVVVAVAAAALATLVVFFVTSPGPHTPELPPNGIAADAQLSPVNGRFADTFVIRVEALVHRDRIEPESLKLSGRFPPFTPAGRSAERQDLGDVARVTQTLRLRCVTLSCLPPELTSNKTGRKTYSMLPVRLEYERVGGTKGSLTLALPAVDVVTRLSESDATLLGDLGFVPFHASAELEPISYAISPALLVALLLVAATALLALAGWLALRFGRRPREPVVEPAPPPPVVLTPLERALSRLERARADGSTADERRALEALAVQLARHGAPGLATTATGLAWSAAGPTKDGTVALADEVRLEIARRNGHP